MKVPFECDLCHFRNINKRDPVLGSKRDEDTFVAIRRPQLDVFWARGSSNVTSNLSRMRRDYLESTTMFSLGDEIILYLSNRVLVDRVGMVPVIMTLGASLRQKIIARTSNLILFARLQLDVAMLMTPVMLTSEPLWDMETLHQHPLP